jgi:rubrerythrin
MKQQIEELIKEAEDSKEWKICTDCDTRFKSDERCPECNPMG